MCRRNALASALLAAALTFAPAANAQQTSTLEAGAAAADITGRVGTPMFAYTARSYLFSPDPEATQQRLQGMVEDPDTGLYAKTFEPSTGIHTRLLARAIVLRKDGQKYALAQADLGGLPYALVQEVAGRIKPTGIDASHILLSATHTHSSVGAIWPADNNGYAFVGGDAFDPRVFDSTAQGIAEAIIAADSRLKPARVGIGVDRADGASRNRSFEAFKRNKDIPPASDPEARRAASVDPTVTVLRVDRPNGTPVALWSNFAVHPTSFGDGNLLFSGDNAGIAARVAEQAIRAAAGKKAAGFVNVWSNGAQGDISPTGETASVGGQALDYTDSEASKAHLAGERDAAGIVRAWRDARSHLSGDLPLDARSFFFAFDGVTEYGADDGSKEVVSAYPVLGAGGIVADDGTCAPVDDMAGPGQGSKVPVVGGPGLATPTAPVSFWRIGDTGIASFPVEITKQMGERIRDGLVRAAAGKLDRVVIAGLTNGYWSYTTTPEEYDYCGYEGSFTLFGRQEGYGWLAAGNQLMDALLAGKPAPAGFPEPPSFGFATDQTTPIRATEAAGTAVKQPADVARYGPAIFSWQGGDPQVDAPRGRSFVSLQRKQARGWKTVATDDTWEDTTERGKGDVWTETFEMGRCRALGTYRFHVTGRAVRSVGGVAEPYVVDSEPFEVSAAPIDPGAVSVAGGIASVRPLYPDPGAAALSALPRLVLDADVSFVLADGRVVAASDDDNNGTYDAAVGDAAVSAVRVADSCGNHA